MASNEERYKAAMTNAVKTIKGQKEEIEELRARVQELEETLVKHGLPVPGKRKRGEHEDAVKMEVEENAGGGGGKKAKGGGDTEPPPPSTGRSKALGILSLKKSSTTTTTNNKNKKKIDQAKPKKQQQQSKRRTAAADSSDDEHHKHPHHHASDDDQEEEEDIHGAGTILEEVAQLWSMVKDKPFAESKFTQLALDRYVFCRELNSLNDERMDAGVQRMVLLLREAGQIPPQQASHRILVTYKRKMAQALRKDREGFWLQDPLYRHSEAGRLVAVATAVVLRLCEAGSYGAYFLELVLDELLQQLYKLMREVQTAGGGAGGALAGGGGGGKKGKGKKNEEGEGEGGSDEEEEEEDDDDDEQDKDKDKDKDKDTHSHTSNDSNNPDKRRIKTEADHEREREKELAIRHQRQGFAAAALFTWLCKELGAVQRVRALVYDICLLNGRLAPLGPLAAFFHLWGEVLGPQDGVLAKSLLVLFHEAYKHQRDAAVAAAAGAASTHTHTHTLKGEGEGGEEEGEKGVKGAGGAGDAEAKAWVAELAYDGFARYQMGRGKKEEGEDDEGVESADVLALELRDKLLVSSSSSSSSFLDDKKAERGEEEEELVRALVLLTSTQPLEWIEAELLQEYATGELTTPPGMMHLLACLGREVTFRDAVERKSGDMLRRLLVCFSEVLAAEDPHGEGVVHAVNEWADEEEEENEEDKEAQEDAKTKAQQRQLTRLWASKGLADLPGVNVGELKPILGWIQSLSAEEKERLLPSHLLRTIVYNQQRPHCCAIIRQGGGGGLGGSSMVVSTEQQAHLELQAIVHDISIRMASAAVLEQMTHNTLKTSSSRRGPNSALGGGGPEEDVKRTTWTADGGWEHVAIWHLFVNARMDELDYPNRKPSEIVILEGDIVGSPLLGAEVRSLLMELRFRPFPWDVLALSFALPASEKGMRKFKAGMHAAVLPKEGYLSRRGYVLSSTGAAKLSRVWEQYQSVEECMLEEGASGRLTILVPGDGRPVIHLTAHDHAMAALRSSQFLPHHRKQHQQHQQHQQQFQLQDQQLQFGGGGGSFGGGGGGGGGHVGGGVGLLPLPPPTPVLPPTPVIPQYLPEEEEEDLERPPSPGFTPSA